MEEVKIRRARYEDIDSIVDIQINGWRNSYRGIIDDEYLDNMDRKEKIEKRKNDYEDFIVAELFGKVVGFSRYTDSSIFTPEVKEADSELLALYVKTDLKNKGIGTKLFNYIVQEFKSKGKNMMVLWCLKDNFKSRGFYEKMGGKIIAERGINIGAKEYMEVCFGYNI